MHLSSLPLALLCCLSWNVVAASNGISGRDALAVLKSLAGEWRGTIEKQGEAPEVTVLYRVTSAGSAVVETLFPGTGHEMVTVYYMDKDKLVLTHYCAMGNQPRMALMKQSTATDLAFDFIGGANVNPKKDVHMHSARFHIESPDRIVAEWVGYKDGRPGDVKRFTLTRKA